MACMCDCARVCAIFGKCLCVLSVRYCVLLSVCVFVVFVCVCLNVFVCYVCGLLCNVVWIGLWLNVFVGDCVSLLEKRLCALSVIYCVMLYDMSFVVFCVCVCCCCCCAYACVFVCN